jgi:hypothetical protein
MPDWEKLVRERLAVSGLGNEEHNEVIAELAGHLDETFECLRKKGMSEREAIHHALGQGADWRDLGHKIRSARSKEDTMSSRVTQFWLPGLLGFALSMTLEALAHTFGSHPLVLSLGNGTPVLKFYWSWILIMPLAGAIATYLSRRYGASRRTALLSSVFPVLPFATVFMVAVPAGLVIGHPIAYGMAAETVAYMALGWVLAPGIALLAGGLVVHRLGSTGSRGLETGVA